MTSLKERGERPVTISAGAAQWLATGRRGLSSAALFSLTVGLDIRGEQGWSFYEYRHPFDPDDFQRCERMLRAIPEARANLSAARRGSPEWAALIDHWDDIVALMEADVPGVFEGEPKRGRCQRAYDRMIELELAVRAQRKPA